MIELSGVITHHIDNLINYYNLEETIRKVSNLAVTIFDQLPGTWFKCMLDDYC